LQLQVKDVAQFFGVSEKTIYRWIEQDGLPAFRINKQYRFNRVEILEWATARKVNASPQLLRNPVEDTGPLPDFAEALEDGGVFYRVDGTDKDSVLRSVVTLLRLPDAVDREFLLQVLLEREAMGSTSVGDGIAIPHVRNPIVLHIPRPTITLCFLEKRHRLRRARRAAGEHAFHDREPDDPGASARPVEPGLRVARPRVPRGHRPPGHARGHLY
jgi:PTS system nitrogen regulatory IIA component